MKKQSISELFKSGSKKRTTPGVGVKGHYILDRRQEEIDGLSIKERITSPTPKFFKKLKLVGLCLAAASASLLAAPIALPAVVSTIVAYIAVAGTVATAVSQVTVEN